jgi:hypothetical protein
MKSFIKLISQWIYGFVFVLAILCFIGGILSLSSAIDLLERDNYVGIVYSSILLIPSLTFFVYVTIKNRVIGHRLDREHRLRIKNLKSHGTKVLVKLDDVKIKSNKWTKANVEKYEHETLTDFITGRLKKHNEPKTVSINLVSISINPSGKGKIKYKFRSDFGLDVLKIYFATQKETYFYFDSKNPSNNYLDLEFIRSLEKPL